MRTRCPRCHHLQERKSKLARVLCSGCGLTYYRFKPEASGGKTPTRQLAEVPS